MSGIRIAGVVIAAIIAAPFAAADATADQVPPTDILTVTPEELSGAAAAELEAQAREAYAQRRYEDAARAYIELLRMRRGDPAALYDLACCYGRLGNEAQAIAFVQAAWDAGFRDVDHIRQDPDFEKVRDKEYFRILLARLQGESAAAAARSGRPLEVVARVQATVRVVEPDGMKSGTAYPLLVGLHGAGGSIATFIQLFKGNGVAQPFLFCAPEGPYAVAGSHEPGFVWFKPGTGERRKPSPLQRQLGEAYVLAAVDAVRKAYAVDERRIFLMGFSQGGFLAFEVGLKHPEVFAGVIPIGTWLDQAGLTPEEIKRAAARTRVWICHSPDDPSVAPSEARASAAFLTRYGVPVSLVPYAGGHVLNAEVARQVASWVTAPMAAPAR